MIPTKFVEVLFRRLWLVALAVLLVPAAAVFLTSNAKTYESNAVVWVTDPVGEGEQIIGHTSPYLTPAQNRSQALNDLLSTAAFREEVVKASGLLPSDASQDQIKDAAQRLNVWAASSGVNLLNVTARSPDAATAQSVAKGVLSAYTDRVKTELQKSSETQKAYYQQQLAVATQALTEKQAQLTAYVQQHPNATNPNHPDNVAVEYQTLSGQAENQAKVVDGLVAKLQGIDLAVASADTAQASFAIQDQPNLPITPLPDSMVKKVGYPFAGLIFGLLLALTYVYIEYRVDHTIRSQEDLKGLAVPLVGSVPLLQSTQRIVAYTPVGWFLAWRRRDFARETAAAISAHPATHEVNR